MSPAQRPRHAGDRRRGGRARPGGVDRPPLVSHALDVITDALGHPVAVAAAIGLVVAWLGFGPLIGFSDTYQLIINTTTSVVTFVMVFAIQHTTNRETRAINLKLDELLEVVRGADQRLVGVEEQSETVIKGLQAGERRRARS